MYCCSILCKTIKDFKRCDKVRFVYTLLKIMCKQMAKHILAMNTYLLIMDIYAE